MTTNAYTELQAHLKDITLIGETMGVLQWDNQTYMPKRGILGRIRVTRIVSKAPVACIVYYDIIY